MLRELGNRFRTPTPTYKAKDMAESCRFSLVSQQFWPCIVRFLFICFLISEERQHIAQKGVRAIDARNSQLENGPNAAKNQCLRSRAVSG